MSKGGSQNTHSSTNTDMHAKESAYQQNFTSPEMKAAYGKGLSRAFDNFDSMQDLAKSWYNDYKSGKNLGDDSYYKQGWNQWQGLNTDNLNKLNLQSYNPNDNSDWVSANDTIDANARRGWGKTLNQVNQNMIASGMANGSGHQTAAYQTAAGLNSQLAADRANRWQQQYNQNVANMMNANDRLNNIYQGRTNAGLDAWKTSQQGYSQMLNGYNQANSALGTLGNFIQMGSDPTVTTEGRQWGTSETDSQTERKAGWGDMLGSAIGLFSRRW